VADELTLRALEQHEWPDAMRLATRSFVSEPFMVEMYGAEPVRRFALANKHYRSSPWRADELHVAAFVGDVLVGFCLCSLPGRCHICTDIDPERPPEDKAEVLDWQFEVNVQTAHADQGTHAWISRVAVDPVLHGAGIGRTLMSQAIAVLRAHDVETVLLECQVHREQFYVACGFHRAATFPDPLGPDAILLRAELAPPKGTMP
jgi:ribosomal protein S18 acetylase RimI-like enzyme